MLSFCSPFAHAATLAWDPNPEPEVAGYRVYSGRVSRAYDSFLDTGILTAVNVPTSPGTNFFAVTAYDVNGLESDYSVEVSLVVSNANTAPAAFPDMYAVSRNATLTVPASSGVLANDTDGNGDTLTASLVSGPASGSLTLNANGSFNYTPAANYVGTMHFVYACSDGAATSTATVTIIVSNPPPANTAPIALNDSYSTTRNVLLSVSASGVLGNDSDADGQPLSAILVSGPVSGTLNLSANGGFTYAPALGFSGSDSFTYRASDGVTNSAVASVSITVVAPPASNSPPVAQVDFYTAAKNTTLTVNGMAGVLANDQDPDNQTLSVMQHGWPARGDLILYADGSFNYTPTNNFVGTDTFAYRVLDGIAIVGPITVTITITGAPPANVAPISQADSYSTTKNLTLTVNAASGVLANDTDADGNSLTAVLVSGPGHGSLTLNANGSFTFAPAANFVGSDSFTYRANDGSANSAVTTVTLTINAPPNSAPVTQADSYSTTKNVTLSVNAASGVLANDTDADGNPLTAVLVNSTAHGALTLNANGSFSYVPGVNFVGSDAFTYRANDGAVNSALTTVTLTINPPPNSAPVAQADSYSTLKNTTLTIAAPGLLANDTDVDVNALSAVLVNGPANGTLTLNANGGFSYTPLLNFVGADSFTYRANDGTVSSSVASVSISVMPPPNIAPVAQEDSYSTTKNSTLTVNAASGVLANDMDSDGHPLSANLLSAPGNGSLTLNADGSFTYSPSAGFIGTDSFTYRAHDGVTNSAAVIVSLTVTPPPNTAPLAQADSYNTIRNTTLVAGSSNGLLANDTDPDGNALAAALVSAPARGSLALNPDGTFIYVPTNNFVGKDSFAYRATDGLTNSAVVTVTILINPPPNSPPVARGENYAVTRNSTLTIAAPGVLANDTDADGNTLTVALVSGAAHGTVSLNVNGGFTYVPVANFTGSDSFTYRAYDGFTNSGIATVFIAVNPPPNSPPVAAHDHYEAVKNTPLVIAAAQGVLANDSDVDGQSLTATLFTPAANGSVVLTPGGSFVYTPASTFIGTDSFTYRAGDGVAFSTAVVTIIVAEPPPVNVPPVAQPDEYTMIQNALLEIPAFAGVLVNDTDANGNSLSASLASGASHGTVLFNSDGSFVYTPQPNFAGVDGFTYVANDGTNFSSATLVIINVNEPPVTNSPPVAQPDNYATVKHTPIYVPWVSGVLANDSDADGDSLVATLVSQAAHGVVTLNFNGGFVYTPGANFTGTDQFAYEADDGTEPSVVAIVTIVVNEPTQTNAVPIARPDTYFTTRNTILQMPATSGVLINDSDADGEEFTTALVFPPAHGTVTLNLDGSFSYAPVENFVGSDTFAYEITDGVDSSAPTLVTISVTDNSSPPDGCPDCFVALDNVMAERSIAFAAVIEARKAVPKNATCPQYDVLVFRTLTRLLGPLHDSAANKALAQSATCVKSGLEDDLAPRIARAASLAPSKYTTSASNYFATVFASLDAVGTSSNNSSRSKLFVASVNSLLRADKALNAGDLAAPSLEGRIVTCTFTRRGQTSRGTFVFAQNTFVVEDENGVPIKTGSYSYTRTAWNCGEIQIAFDQPTLGYAAGEPVAWVFKYGRVRHRIAATGLRGYFTLQ